MDLVLVSFVYPDAIKYFKEFLNSILSQEYQKFDILLFCDIDLNHLSIPEDLKKRVLMIPVNGTPLEIRFDALDFLIKHAYNSIIFHDLDDQMSINRVSETVRLLEKYDLVCNDLSIMSIDGQVSTEHIWKDRLGDIFEFDYQFIMDKNIVGFGNTAIRKDLLNNVEIFRSQYPKVADWFLFFQIIASNKASCCFTGNCSTFYRQHDSNIAGIRDITRERIEKAIQVKIGQYMGLIDIGYDVQVLCNKTLDLQKKIKDKRIIKTESITPFWWEETNFIL